MEDLANWTVNQIVATFPETLRVFQEHRIDLCCGGGLTLAEVARKHRIDLDRLLREIDAAARLPA